MGLADFDKALILAVYAVGVASQKGATVLK
jgi:hypothetical protein